MSKKKNKNNSEQNAQSATVSRTQTAQRPAVRQQPRPPMNQTRTEGSKPAKSWQRYLRRAATYRVLLVIFIVLAATLPSLYFYHKGMQAEQNARTPSSSNLQTTAAVVKQVSRHILLPSGEQPTVATVSDASKVRGQAFFANAASGDKVLIYAQAKKAYLYRPSIDRIIEVAPLAPSKTPSP